MTWQRIDENTYIDDTLVTCAEYQLFIDEMREQGKYYQPDHWTSYQFLAGQAREPILGVRHSDAVAFCEWIINSDEPEWKFRLPSRDEANIFPLRSIQKEPIGYWIINDNYPFVWIGPTIINAHRIDDAFDLTRTIDFVRSRALDIGLDHVLNRVLFPDPNFRIQAVDLARTRALKIGYALGDRDRVNIDLLTLKERIIGLSPAFEGIRLVKERIR